MMGLGAPELFILTAAAIVVGLVTIVVAIAVWFSLARK
jgi:hypothetical protein